MVRQTDFVVRFCQSVSSSVGKHTGVVNFGAIRRLHLSFVLLLFCHLSFLLVRRVLYCRQPLQLQLLVVRPVLYCRHCVHQIKAFEDTKILQDSDFGPQRWRKKVPFW